MGYFCFLYSSVVLWSYSGDLDSGDRCGRFGWTEAAFSADHSFLSSVEEGGRYVKGFMISDIPKWLWVPSHILIVFVSFN